ncbi:TPA: hypothetical protein DEP94_03355 [Candidatus Nomurabacteria bacterium]|nr:hypothetical protein [Candidatus Nomurabacteria bacterium]
MKDKCKGLNEYILKDKKYMTTAITVTIRRFGPSGSSKKKNIAREERRDVMNKIMRDVFFDLKYMI